MQKPINPKLNCKKLIRRSTDLGMLIIFIVKKVYKTTKPCNSFGLAIIWQETSKPFGRAK